jgi:hypothetical protein
MEIKDIIQNSNNCACTPIEHYNCDVCGKPINIIDSPFGSIPTLKMMEDYISYSSHYLYNYLKSCLDILNAEVTKSQNDAKNQLSQSIQTKLSEIEQKSNQFLENIKKDHDLLSKTIREQYDSQNNAFDILTTNFNNEVQSRLQILDKKIETLTLLSNQTQEITTKSIQYLLQIMQQTLKLSEQFIKSKDDYIETILPDYKVLLENVQILTKIIPKDVRAFDVHGQSSEEFFKSRQQLINPIQMGNINPEIIFPK